jgi:hypothetical protein
MQQQWTAETSSSGSPRKSSSHHLMKRIPQKSGSQSSRPKRSHHIVIGNDGTQRFGFDMPDKRLFKTSMFVFAMLMAFNLAVGIGVALFFLMFAPFDWIERFIEDD